MTHVWRYLVGLVATAAAVATMVAGYVVLMNQGTANTALAVALLATITIPFVWIVVMAHRGANAPLFSAQGMLVLIIVLIPGVDLVVPYLIGRYLLRKRFRY